MGCSQRGIPAEFVIVFMVEFSSFKQLPQCEAGEAKTDMWIAYLERADEILLDY